MCEEMSIKRQLSSDRTKWTQSRGSFNTQVNGPGERKTLYKPSDTSVWGTTLALESETSPMETPWTGLLPEKGGVTAAPDSSLSSRAALTETNWALSTKQAPWGVFQPRGARTWIFNRLSCLWERETMKIVWKNVSCWTISRHKVWAVKILKLRC